MKRSITAVVALTLVACTDGGGPATTPAPPADTVASRPSTGPTTNSAPPPGTVTVAPPSSTPVSSTPAPITVASAPTPTSSPVATPAPLEQWCPTAERLHELTAAFRQLDAADSAAVQVSLVGILDELAQIAEVVPDELADDLAVSTEAFELLDAALAEVRYDLGAADLTALDARADAIATANDRIRAYNAAECGIDIGVTGEDVP